MVALPHLFKMAVGVGALINRNTRPSGWKSPASRPNLAVSISSESICWGDHQPKDIIKVLRDNCYKTGCDKGVEIDTYVVQDQKRYLQKLKMEVLDSTFPSKGPGGKTAMIDALEKVLQWDTVLKKKREHWSAPEGCPNHASAFCHTPEGNLNQWWAPKTVILRFENDRDGDLTSELRVSITVEAPEGSTACQDVMKHAGAIADTLGKIPNSGQIGFILGDLLCKALGM